jgi:cytidine deaminase
MSHHPLRPEAIKASQFSHSPYSAAKVGSAVITESNQIYLGCNIENSSFGATVCAERVAIWKAISSGEKKIKSVYVYTKDGWPPCGMCLQVMSEFSDNDLEIIVGDAQGNEKKYDLSKLLPQAFTPEHLKKYEP